MQNNNIINNWLKDNGDPSIERQVKRNLRIASRIKEILDEKKWKPSDLARVMEKSQAEISKWLSGQHTLSQYTISKIEIALQQDIIAVTSILDAVHSASQFYYILEKLDQETPIKKSRTTEIAWNVIINSGDINEFVKSSKLSREIEDSNWQFNFKSSLDYNVREK